MKDLSPKEKPLSVQINDANNRLYNIWCKKVGILYRQVFSQQLTPTEYNFQMYTILQPLTDLFDLELSGDNHKKGSSHLYLIDKEKKIELGRIVYNDPTKLFNGEALFVEREYKFDGVKRGATELYGTAITGLKIVMEHYTNYTRYNRGQLLKLEKYLFEETG